MYRPQQMPLCSPGSSFQLPGLKNFLPNVENWAKVFSCGTAQMATVYSGPSKVSRQL